MCDNWIKGCDDNMIEVEKKKFFFFGDIYKQ